MQRLTATREGDRAWVMPAIVLVLILGVLVYVGVTPLDSIEARSLAPSVIVTATLEHIQLVLISAVITVTVGVPLGILLTRRSARRVGSVVLAASAASLAMVA